MAVIVTTLRVWNAFYLVVDEIPSNGAGTPAGIGSLAIVQSNSAVYEKTGISNTAWALVIPEPVGSGITRQIISVNAPTLLASNPNTDYVYLVSGTTTVTLPTAVDTKNQYTIKNVGIAVVTIETTGGQTIDLSPSVSLPVSQSALSLISDNANWNIV